MEQRYRHKKKSYIAIKDKGVHYDIWNQDKLAGSVDPVLIEQSDEWEKVEESEEYQTELIVHVKGRKSNIGKMVEQMKNVYSDLIQSVGERAIQPMEKYTVHKTEDGITICPDNLYYLLDTSSWNDNHSLSGVYWSDWRVTHGLEWKVFSTEDARQEYIMMNKPMFSIKEILDDVYGEDRYKGVGAVEEILEKMAEEKLKNQNQ